MLAGIREVLIITNAEDVSAFEKLFGDGSRLGMEIKISVQDRPGGLPEAFVVGEEFLDGHPSVLILGDNLFHGSQLSGLLREKAEKPENTVFLFYVNDPSAYGVAVMNAEGQLVDVVEKPTDPISNHAITGLYFFDSDAPKIARELKPSGRGELEITDMIRHYHMAGKLSAVALNRGVTWIDMGTARRVMSATVLIDAIDKSRNLKVAVPEEIAWRNGWIGEDELFAEAKRCAGTPYSMYLTALPEMMKFSR